MVTAFVSNKGGISHGIKRPNRCLINRERAKSACGVTQPSVCLFAMTTVQVLYTQKTTWITAKTAAGRAWCVLALVGINSRMHFGGGCTVLSGVFISTAWSRNNLALSGPSVFLGGHCSSVGSSRCRDCERTRIVSCEMCSRGIIGAGDGAGSSSSDDISPIHPFLLVTSFVDDRAGTVGRSRSYNNLLGFFIFILIYL